VTEGDGGLDEEKADRRKMAEIQGQMEARQAAKDLEIARVTLQELKTLGSSVAPTVAKTSKKEVERDRREKEKKGGTTRGTKEETVSQVAAGIPVGESGASVRMALVERTPVSSSSTRSVPIAIADRAKNGKRATSVGLGEGPLSTLKFSAIETASLREVEAGEDAADVELGLALVAGALGKKVPRKSVARSGYATTACYVALMDPRKKSGISKVVAPPNFVDSEEVEHDDTGSEIRLSQSDVHIGFPVETGEITTSAGVASRDREATSVEVSTNPNRSRSRDEIATATIETGVDGRVMTPVSK